MGDTRLDRWRMETSDLIDLVEEAEAEVQRWKDFRSSQIDQEAKNAIEYAILCRERDAALAEVERLKGELEELREFQHGQANAANDKILALERENLKLKRHLSPIESKDLVP